MEKMNVMAKEDMIEDVRAVYGDATADQIGHSTAVTLVEIVLVDERGNERVLDHYRGTAL